VYNDGARIATAWRRMVSANPRENRKTEPVLPASELPVHAVLPELIAALEAACSAVLVAPPGTGKTTLVPLALADRLTGRVVVAEPRRIAARAAARRMAELVGEPVGVRVGFSVRGEQRTSPATRVEVVTTGVLVQRLQRDPELAGTAAIMIDECHERHLETDLALAFGVDVRAALRPDLLLLAASATAQAERIAQALGSAPIVEATGALHPVETVWCPAPAGITPPHGLRVDPRLLDHLAATIQRALAETTGDVLAFLPGAGEIAAVANRLRPPRDVEVLPLHGRLPAAAQDAALRPVANRRRVVLATAVAESSLTVPGVRVVVDAGLSRVPRTDLARGLGSLVTVRASRSSAIQRAGRAGREAAGTAYRCWSQAEHERLPAHPEPEVATADLTAFALQLACWGAPGGRGLVLLDPAPEAAMTVASAVLRDLGAVDEAGRVTARGRALAAVGAHPRLARALLDGSSQVGSRRAAEVVAMLSDDALPGSADDLAARWRALRAGHDRAASGRWQEEVKRLQRGAPRGSGRSARADAVAVLPDDLAAATVVGLAFPERLARRRRADGRTYLMASGTAAELGEGSGLSGAEWLAVAVADRPPGRRDARIRLAVPLDEATARQVGEPLRHSVDEVVWAGEVRARTVERLGAIELSARPLRSPDRSLVAAAMQEGLRREGLDVLNWTPAARALRRRLAACRSGLGDPWPDVSDDALLAHLDLAGSRHRGDLKRLDVAQALRSLLPWQLAGRLDEVAPHRIEVPSGSRIAVDYSDPEAPALPVKVQEVLGWTAAPQVAGRALRLRLLSPAGRPVAVTSDLESFWSNGYPAVRAELRGRYPRHRWPQDPLAR
jgi:ATP-dependent helicase HrpB